MGGVILHDKRNGSLTNTHGLAPILTHSHLSPQYLFKTCPEEWPIELVGSNITWAEGTKVCDSSDAMTSCIRGFNGTIGYLDSGHAHAEYLQEIVLTNSNGTSLTSKVAMAHDGLASAIVYFPSTASTDFGAVDLINNVSWSRGKDLIAVTFIKGSHNTISSFDTTAWSVYVANCCHDVHVRPQKPNVY
jgi:hypothetical protein